MGINFGQLFRPTQQVTVTNPQQPQQPLGQPTPGSSMQQRAPTMQPGQPQQTNEPEQTNSPLDPFKDLWNTPDSAVTAASADPFSSPLFQADPAKIREAAKQMDFISQISPELMQKAMSGQDPQAFLEVINQVAQTSLATSLQLSTATMEQAGSKIGERFNKALPSRFRDLQINEQQPSNPVLQHPAAQGMLKVAKQQVKMMNPDATPQQVQQMAEQFLSSFASTLTTDPNAAAKAEAEEFNWMNWAGQSQN